jgi:hypothetical protein
LRSHNERNPEGSYLMKYPRASFALAAGLLVSAGVIYEADATNATMILGFTPMSEFEKVYPPACQPLDESGNTLSALIAGALVGVLWYYVFGILGRLLPKS